MFKHPFYSMKGVITTESTLASVLGLKVLESGGNAVDASIVASLTLAVTHPHLGGLGGDYFALVMDTNGRVHFINGSGWSPRKATIEKLLEMGFKEMPDIGVHSIVVPGMVDGLRVLWEKFGSIEWSKLVRLVEEYMRKGFPMSHSFASMLNTYKEALFKDEASRKTYFGKKEQYKEGDIFKWDGLMRALKIISEDPRSFYEGEIAEKMVNYLRAKGSLFDKDDFKDFKAEFSSPLKITIGKNVVYEMPPNTQGVTTLQLLELLEELPNKYDSKSRERVEHHLNLYKAVYTIRDEFIGDPFHMKVSADLLLDREFLKSYITKKMNNYHAKDGSDTTYYAAIDDSGMIVSGIQSLFTPFGALLTEPEFEITFNKRASSFNFIKGHPNSIGSRKRPLHTLSALIIESEGSTVAMGLSGAHYRPQLHAQIYENIYRFGMNPQEALEHPRFQWDPQKKYIEFEEGIRAEDIEIEKRKREYPSRIGVAAIAEIKSSKVRGAYSDIRGDGIAIGQA